MENRDKFLSTIDCFGKNVLEIGPKHGRHTQIVSSKKPKSITCVDLPHKKELVSTWSKRIEAPLTIHFADFLRWETKEKYDVILFAGVIYHNTEQLRLLKKLQSLSTDSNTILYFESATTRNEDLKDKNVIEVHWPKAYRDIPTLRFLPSHSACYALLEMAGWEIIEKVTSNSDRIEIICRNSGEKLKTYIDVDHEYLEKDSYETDT